MNDDVRGKAMEGAAGPSGGSATEAGRTGAPSDRAALSSDGAASSSDRAASPSRRADSSSGRAAPSPGRAASSRRRAAPSWEDAGAVSPDDGDASSRGRAQPPGLGFLGFILTWIAAWWLPVGALIRPVVPGGMVGVLGLAALSLLPAWALGRAFFADRYPSARVRIFVFRPFWYVHLFMPLAAAAGVLGVIVGLPFGIPGTVGRIALAAAMGLLVVLSVAGYFGSRALVVRPLDLALPTLPEGLDGLRIAQISDLHVGPQTPQRFLARVSASVMASEPDLIVVTGDQVDDFAEDVRHFAAGFGGLAAPLGVYAIAGNHDVYAGWHGVREGLEGMGMRVLVNEAVPLERGGDTLWLAGTGDPAAGPARLASADRPAPDVDRTLADVPNDAFMVALAHNPALWPALADRGVQVTLSGHTHYGQLTIPWLGWSVVSPFLRYALGQYRRDGQVLHINPGTNHWGVPFRLGTPAEVTLVTLRRKRD